jgi:NADPH:quinone reductase-like Zn-dependent oxidoreductase
MKKMRSIVYDRYGGPDVLTLMQTSVPEPAAGEILIRVISSSVTAADWHLRKADPFMVRLMNGLFKPKRAVLGQEFFGEVDEVGSNVTRFKKGDLVFGSTGMKTGAHSEYIILDEESVICRVPKEMASSNLAAVPIGTMTAQFFLDKGGLSKGARVLINGASGSVGTYAVQIAKAKGAEVTGVCSTSNVKMVKDLGADDVIDYKKIDFTSTNETYNLIFDTVGNLRFGSIRKNLTSDGRFVSTAFNISLMLSMIMNRFRKGQEVFTGVTRETQDALDDIAQMLRDGIMVPVIDREYSKEEIREAHAYAESGRKRGNLLINITGGTHHV